MYYTSLIVQKYELVELHIEYMLVFINNKKKGLWLMLDTRGLGIDYTRKQLSEFKKIRDIFFNDSRYIYAELLIDDEARKVYFREWLASNNPDASYNFCIINSLQELKEELNKDVSHGDLSPIKAREIYNDFLDNGL